MARSHSEKAADGLIQGVARRDWNPQLFVGHIMEQPKEVQKILVLTFLLFLAQYKQNAQNPYLSYRVDEEAADWIEPIDLTGFDQI